MDDFYFEHPCPVPAYAVVADKDPEIKIGLIFTDHVVAWDIARKMEESLGIKHRATPVQISSASFW